MGPPDEQPDADPRLRDWGRVLASTEGRILITGLCVTVLHFLCIGLTWAWRPGLAQRLLELTTAHVIGGRAAGISAGMQHPPLAFWLVVGANIVIEAFIVLLLYPLFVLSYRKLIVIGPLRASMERAQRYAEANQKRIMKYGIPGLLLFVWFPFWMTGPVVGSVIGFLIGLRPWVTMVVVLTGTSLAIVCWGFLLDQVFVQLRALGPYVPLVFVALVILVAISIHIRQAIWPRPNGPQPPNGRDQE